MATSALLASVCSLLCAAAAGAERAAFSTCSAAGWSVVTHCLGADHLVTLLPAESSAHLRVGPGGCAGVPRRPPVSHQGKPVGPGEWDKVIVGLEWGEECIKYATTEEIGSIRTLSFSVLGLTFPISKTYGKMSPLKTYKRSGKRAFIHLIFSNFQHRRHTDLYTFNGVNLSTFQFLTYLIKLSI